VVIAGLVVWFSSSILEPLGQLRSETIIIDEEERRVLVPARKVSLGFEEFSAVCLEIQRDETEEKEEAYNLCLSLVTSQSVVGVRGRGEWVRAWGAQPGFFHSKLDQAKKELEARQGFEREALQKDLKKIEECMREFDLLVLFGEQEEEIRFLARRVAKTLNLPLIEVSDTGLTRIEPGEI
jgi:hypothetical protein